MDDLIVGLSNSLCTEIEQQNEPVHPRYSQFKNEGKLAEKQRQRREEHLERQARARDDWLKRGRELSDTNSSERQNAFAMRSKRMVGGEAGCGKRSKNPYVNCLMFSDWLVDIPGTLSTEWTLVPSPVGRRTLVVAKKGTTNVYFKNGHLCTHFQSDLPGGSSISKGSGSMTILDCIFAQSDKKLYVLDMLWWDKKMYTDNTFELRRFFLRSHLEELKIESTPRTSSPYQFVALPSCACSPEAISEFMFSEFDFELDGLLFYYNSVYYIPEQTPLVGWLKPWMLPEILGICVPERYTKNVDKNSQQFIDEFNETHNHLSSSQKKLRKEEEHKSGRSEQDEKAVPCEPMTTE